MPHGRTYLESLALIAYLEGRRTWPELTLADFAPPRPKLVKISQPATRRRRYVPPADLASRATTGLVADAIADERSQTKPTRRRKPGLRFPERAQTRTTMVCNFPRIHRIRRRKRH